MRAFSVLTILGLLCAPTLVGATANPADLTPTATSSASAPPPLTQADVSAWLDGRMPYALDQAHIPGAVVVVVKDGRILFQKGYGYADLDKRKPVDPQLTLFRPGSISKLFTWTAVMQLIEQGKLELDRDVNDYLDFKIPARQGGPVTLRNLMTHTPGFEEIARNMVIKGSRNPLSLADFYHGWIPQRIFAPGEIPAYSNYGAGLAGYIVQRVSGERFEDYIERHIFGPLGMNHSTFEQPLPAGLQPLMSLGYNTPSDVADFDCLTPAPAGGASATGADMARFMIAHLHDGQYGDAQILRPETARLMHDTIYHLYEATPPVNAMALGFYQENRNGQRIIGHGGDLGAFHSDLHLFLDRDVGLFISMNSGGEATGGNSETIRDALLKDFTDRYFPDPMPPTAPAAKTAAEHGRLVAGNYELSRRSQSNVLSAMRIQTLGVELQPDATLRVPDLKDPLGRIKVWRETAPFVWSEVNGGSRLVFKVDHGTVTSLTLGTPYMVWQPVASWRSAWMRSAIMAAYGALLLTVLQWPVGALVRRHYRVQFALTGGAASSYRWVRYAALLELVIVGLWTVWATLFIQGNPTADTLIVLTAKLLGFGVFPAVLISLWDAWGVWTGRRHWWTRIWSLALCAAFLVIACFTVMFHLLGWATDY